MISNNSIGGFQYSQQLLEFFPHAEGYVKATNLSLGNNPNYAFNYVYNYTDHLGNVRLSYAKDPQTGNLKILDESHYYPFGLKHEVYSSLTPKGFSIDNELGRTKLITIREDDYKYKYNGKEWQDELSLNMYAMDMRMYDPAIARWVVQDPITHFDFSPYNAFDNNPVYWADPSGADAVNIGYDRVVEYAQYSGSLQMSRFDGGDDNGKINIIGQNKKTISIEIGGNKNYNISVPYDLEENVSLDINSLLEGFNSDNWALGYTARVGIEATGAVGAGASASITVIRYFNKEYGGYNYFYGETELTGYDGATLGFNVNIEGSIFIMSNAYSASSIAGSPSSFVEGHASSTGVGRGFVAEVGGGGNVFAFRSGNWHGGGFGVSGGAGYSINLLSVFHSVTRTSVMFNNQIPTRDRSKVDRAINAPANIFSLGQALYQHAKK